MALCAVLLVVSACNGDGDTSDEPAESAPTSIAKLSDIPGAVLLTKPDEPDAPATYRTAEITSVSGDPDARTVNVNFESGPDLCSVVSGYAVDESDTTISVTVIIGEQKNCTGEPTTRTTVLNVKGAVGDRDVVASTFSETSLPIEDPSA